MALTATTDHLMNSVKAGDTFALANLHTTGNAVMWDVVNLQNLRNPAPPQKAHFTVYFGTDACNKHSDFA